MIWHYAETDPPKHTNGVIVSDGEDGYAIAWYAETRGWSASEDMLIANNYDGGCCIDVNDVVWWSEIPKEGMDI